MTQSSRALGALRVQPRSSPRVDEVPVGNAVLVPACCTAVPYETGAGRVDISTDRRYSPHRGTSMLHGGVVGFLGLAG